MVGKLHISHFDMLAFCCSHYFENVLEKIALEYNDDDDDDDCVYVRGKVYLW